MTSEALAALKPQLMTHLLTARQLGINVGSPGLSTKPKEDRPTRGLAKSEKSFPAFAWAQSLLKPGSKPISSTWHPKAPRPCSPNHQSNSPQQSSVHSLWAHCQECPSYPSAHLRATPSSGSTPEPSLPVGTRTYTVYACLCAFYLWCPLCLALGKAQVSSKYDVERCVKGERQEETWNFKSPTYFNLQ